MSIIRCVSHIVNCGYARTTIYENSHTQRGCNGRQNIDIKKRAQKLDPNLAIAVIMASQRAILIHMERMVVVNLTGTAKKFLMALRH